MPKEGRLDPSKTFESQQELVTGTIIPTIKQLIDFTVYPVNENVLYQIIYRRHRSQRDTYRINNKELEGKKKESKRKHKNTRRSEVISMLTLKYLLMPYLFIYFIDTEKAKKNENDQQSKKQ
jgi:hypothetical protein